MDPKDNPYEGLRSRMLALKSGELDGTAAPVYGLLMETGYDAAVVTLVALRDGTVSLYFSNGGGMIGIGENERPFKICLELLAGAPHFLNAASPTTEFPLPGKSETIFYFLTTDGVKTFRAAEVDLGERRSPLSPLFHKCHELITAAREISESQKR